MPETAAGRATDEAVDILDRLMALWQEPWTEEAFGEAQFLVPRLRTAVGFRGDGARLSAVRDYVFASVTISALDRDRLLRFIDEGVPHA